MRRVLLFVGDKNRKKHVLARTFRTSQELQCRLQVSHCRICQCRKNLHFNFLTNDTIAVRRHTIRDSAKKMCQDGWKDRISFCFCSSRRERIGYAYIHSCSDLTSIISVKKTCFLISEVCNRTPEALMLFYITKTNLSYSKGNVRLSLYLDTHLKSQ